MSKTNEQPSISCWHCGDVLELEGRPHCERCPADGECDVDGCEEFGCSLAELEGKCDD